MRNFLGLVVFALAVFSTPEVAFAGCQADVDVANHWEEKGGFVQKAKLKVKIESARPGAFVRVHVEVRFHYERSDGWANTASTSDSVSFDTSDHSSESFVIDTRAVNCSDDKPCDINDVEVIDISCYD